MGQVSMTALVSAFSRAYHARENAGKIKIFDDSIAEKLFSKEEYNLIAKSMSEGIEYFAPGFSGTKEQALRLIVDSQLSPTPLGRSAFTESRLRLAAGLGAEQYIIFGAGYDTFSNRRTQWARNIVVFELDRAEVIDDKIRRLERAGIEPDEKTRYIKTDFLENDWYDRLVNDEFFDGRKISFCSILGVLYYISENMFENMLNSLEKILLPGSSIVFDYPDENSQTERAGERAKRQRELAGKAGEKMVSGYSYEKIEKMLADHGFLIYEHLTPCEITENIFSEYNNAAAGRLSGADSIDKACAGPGGKITAPENVNYCLAVKQMSRSTFPSMPGTLPDEEYCHISKL